MNPQEAQRALFQIGAATAFAAASLYLAGKPESSQAQGSGNNLYPSYPNSLIIDSPTSRSNPSFFLAKNPYSFPIEAIQNEIIQGVEIGPIADIGTRAYNKDIAIYQLPNGGSQIVEISEGPYGVGIYIDGITATHSLELAFQNRVEIPNTPDYSRIKPVVISNGQGQFLGFYEIRRTHPEVPSLNIGVVYFSFNNGQLVIEKSTEIPRGSYKSPFTALYPQQGIVTISPIGESRYTVLSHLGLEGSIVKHPGLFHIDSDFNIDPVQLDGSDYPGSVFLPEQMVPIDNNHIFAASTLAYAVFNVNTGERTTDWGTIPNIYTRQLTRFYESSGKVFFAAEETEGPDNSWLQTGITHFFETDPQTMEITDVLQIRPDVHDPQLIPLAPGKFLLIYGNGYNTPDIHTATMWGQVIVETNSIWQKQGNPFIVSSPNGQSDYTTIYSGASTSNFIGNPLVGVVSWNEGGKTQQARMVENITNTPSQTPSPTPSATETTTSSPTASPSSTKTPSQTPSPTSSATETTTPSATASPSSTETPSLTPTQTKTPTPSPTNTKTATPPNKPTATPTKTPPVPLYRVYLPYLRR